VGYKERARWEQMRRDIATRKHCAAIVYGCPRMMWKIREGDPIACDLNDPQNLRDIPPPYEVWHHALMLEFVGKHECGADCGVVKQPYKSGMDGFSLIDRIRMSHRIEDTVGMLTKLRGNKTLSGKCPLHNEQNGESFVIWTDAQLWKCYGKCGTGGDFINLVYECKKRGINWKVNDPDIERLLKK